MRSDLLFRTQACSQQSQNFLLGAIDGQPGVVSALVRGTLRTLSGAYWGYVKVSQARFRFHLKQTVSLPAEVVSVGNLSLGGTGKTLTVLRLAREYAMRGLRVAVLCIGYGRASAHATAVVSSPDALHLTVEQAGDEPYLLATALPGIPVLVGKDRRATGRHALEAFGSQVLLLDDGFQYLPLRRDREIVLVDALQPPHRDSLFPRGLLREPWSHLSRAHEVWITHAGLADPERVGSLSRLIAHYAPRALLRFTEHRPVALRTSQGEAPLSLLAGRRVLALSSLGNPAQFELMLAALGAQVTPCRYPDHHRYTADDIRAIAGHAHDTLVVTTPKDALRLPADLPFPLHIVDVELADIPAPER
ncbi:MAG TPA: tetraacyldisaccharide 4'-kinase [Armatimonadota bacterium]|jgi:tetraacyldisaccharide 4'-kinase